MVQNHFWKNAFLTHFHPFLVPQRPNFKAFWHFPWVKMRDLGLELR